MNNFCESLGDSLREKFKIEVEVFVSNKKKLVHMSLRKPPISYKFLNRIINFVRI